MAKANYFNENLKPVVLDVLKDNKDGTVDLGTGKVLVVGSAKLVETPTVGGASLIAEEKQADEKSKK